MNTDYQTIAEKNREQFMVVMKQAMPDFFIVAKMIEDVKFNPVILFHTIRYIADIANGTGYGQVHIVIEDGIVRFVKGEHSSRLNEPVIKDNTVDNPDNSNIAFDK